MCLSHYIRRCSAGCQGRRSALECLPWLRFQSSRQLWDYNSDLWVFLGMLILWVGGSRTGCLAKGNTTLQVGLKRQRNHKECSQSWTCSRILGSCLLMLALRIKKVLVGVITIDIWHIQADWRREWLHKSIKYMIIK